MIRSTQKLQKVQNKVGMTSLGGWSLGFSICVLILVFSFSAYAADDNDAVSTNHYVWPIEELFKTDVVYPEEKGEVEVELGSQYQNNSEGDTWSIPLSLEFGLTDRWQVEAEWNSFVQKEPRNNPTVRGIGDLEIGTQYSFMNIGNSQFHIAPRFSIQIPLGDVNKGLSEGFIEYEPAVILARDFPQLHRTQLFSEIGFSFVQRVKKPADLEDEEPAAHEFNLGTGFFTPVPHGIVSMELNWNNNQWNHNGTDNDLYLTPGFTWKVVKGFKIGLGIPVGLNNSSDRYEVAAHALFEF